MKIKLYTLRQTFPSPAPIIALVGVNISGIPGPPLGPSPLIITTFPWKGKFDREEIKKIFI